MTYIPTIYGFKIFGQKGSAYEYKFDHMGNLVNKKEIDHILNNKITGLSSKGSAPNFLWGNKNKEDGDGTVEAGAPGGMTGISGVPQNLNTKSQTKN